MNHFFGLNSETRRFFIFFLHIYRNKGKFYPTIDIGTITNTMTRLNKQGDVSFLKDCESWCEIYNKTKESELRYRTTIKEVKIPYVVVLNVFHSDVKKIVFSSENFSSLHVNL